MEDSDQSLPEVWTSDSSSEAPEDRDSDSDQQSCTILSTLRLLRDASCKETRDPPLLFPSPRRPPSTGVQRHTRWLAAQAEYATILSKMTQPYLNKVNNSRYGWLRCRDIGRFIKTSYLNGIPVHCLHYGPQGHHRDWYVRLPHYVAPAFRLLQYRLLNLGYRLLDVSRDNHVQIIIACIPIYSQPLTHHLNIVC